MADSVMTISVANSYLRVYDYPQSLVKQVLTPFCARHLYKMGFEPDPVNPLRQIWTVTHAFARYNQGKTELRFTSALLDEFQKFAINRGVRYDQIKIEEEPILVPIEKDVSFINEYPLKESQHEWVDYLLADGQLKLNNAPTGEGKTFMSYHSFVQHKKRMLVILNARFSTMWWVEADKLIELKEGDYLYAEGQTLELYTKALKQGLIDPKVMVVSLTKIDMLLKKTRKDDTIPGLDEFYDAYRPGLRVYDEAHESIHQVYMSMMFGNVAKTIANTATIKSEDAFTNRIYSYLFPKEIRLKDTEYSAHMHIKAIQYRINTGRNRIQTHSRGMYNDITFEASIMNNKKLRASYIELMLFCFKEYYWERRREKTKCLFFFTKIETCKIMVEAIKQRYPGLDIISYTGEQGSKKETKFEYLNHEVVFTTPGSCGTGKDIPFLVTCISFHNVRSNQRNYQMRGRIRPIKQSEYPDLDRIFGYAYCLDVPKHCEYHNYRKELFEDSCLSYQGVDSGVFMY